MIHNYKLYNNKENKITMLLNVYFIYSNIESNYYYKSKDFNH